MGHKDDIVLAKGVWYALTNFTLPRSLLDSQPITIASGYGRNVTAGFHGAYMGCASRFRPCLWAH